MELKYKGLAICGKMGSGKSTLAKHIGDALEKEGVNYSIIPLAKKLKEIAIDLYHMNPNKKDRKLLQTLGDALRSVRADVFVDAVVTETMKGNSFVIVDDLRFDNELECLQTNGFLCVYLDVDDSIRMDRLQRLYPHMIQDECTMLHVSEKCDTLPKESFGSILKSNTQLDINNSISSILNLLKKSE